MKLKKLVVAMGISLLISEVYSAEPSIPPVLVSGWHDNLDSNSPKNPFRTAPSSESHVEVITREQIEELHATNIFEVMNTASGVVSTLGSRKGGFGGLLIRGDSNFRWIIDGAYLQPDMASRILAALPVFSIQEIKIVRGSSSLTLGPMVGSATASGAPVDGFVVVETRKPRKDEVQLRGSAGTYNTYQADLWGGKVMSDQDLKAYIAGLVFKNSTDGPNETVYNSLTYNAGSQTGGGLIKGGMQAYGLNIDVMGYVARGTSQIQNYNKRFSPTVAPGNWNVNPSDNDLFILNATKSWDESNTTLASISRNTSYQNLNTPKTPTAAAASYSNNNENNFMNLKHVFSQDTYRVTLGADYLHWNNPTGMNYYEGIQREESTTGLFTQLEKSFLDNDLNFDVSYRQDQVKVQHGLDSYFGGQAGQRNASLQYSNRTLNPAKFYTLGAQYRVMPDTKVNARYGGANQSPQNVTPMPGVTLGNDQQTKIEFGVEQKVSPLLNPAVNYFSRQVTNEKVLGGYNRLSGTPVTNCSLSESSVIGIPTGIYAACYNQSNTNRSGIEYSTQGVFAERSNYRASWTNFTTLSGAYTSLITPRNIGDFTFAHGMDKFTLTGSVKYVAQYYGITAASTVPAVKIGNYTNFDAGISYDMLVDSVALTTTLYGKNLSNNKYQTTTGIQDWGRVFGVEVIARFQ